MSDLLHCGFVLPLIIHHGVGRLKVDGMAIFFSALGNVLENTALFGDILLRLPDITYKVKYIL